jgi:hypothetical protein
VTDFARLLGLTQPFHVYVDDPAEGWDIQRRPDEWLGAATNFYTDGTYGVILSPLLPGYLVDSVLAHELRHCQQDERGHVVPNTIKMSIGEYDACRYEDEARATEALVKPGDLSFPSFRCPRYWDIRP